MGTRQVEDENNPWTTNIYPREAGFAGIERLIGFTDAVYAIALTLVALEIGIPEITGDSADPTVLWNAMVEKGPRIGAFMVAFAWVAVYWRANHRFTATLRAVSGRYVNVTLLYLAFVAILPVPAAILGEYFENPLSITVFAVFVACVSALEVVLWQIAYTDNLFSIMPSGAYKRQAMVGSSIPVATFLLSIPIAFISTWLAVGFWFVASIASGYLVSKLFRAHPPELSVPNLGQ